MNRVMLIGRLTRDPEIRYSANDNHTAVANYTLAVNRPARQGRENEADFIRCVAFGKTAELAEKYLAQGQKVAVEGRIQTGSYTNRDGQKIYTTEVVVDRMEFLEKKADNSQQPTSDANNPINYDNGFMHIPDGMDEDLPFN